MKRQEVLFSSPDVARILSIDDIVQAFRDAIIYFVRESEKETESYSERFQHEREKDENLVRIIIDNPYVDPLKALLNVLGWENLVPSACSLSDDFQKFQNLLRENDLFKAVQIALVRWKNNFFSDKYKKSRPVYDLSYKKEMLAAIDMEIKYNLYNQVHETRAFRKYLANEQALRLAGIWSSECTEMARNAPAIAGFYRCNSLFGILDDFWGKAGENMRSEMVRFMPGKRRPGNKPKGEKTKNQFMKELEAQCRVICPDVPTEDTFRRNFDKWARDRHLDLIRNNPDL